MKVARSKLVIFSVAVAFVSVFFFAYAIQAFYPAPNYEDFCDVGNKVFINNSADCESIGGKWTDYEGEAIPVGREGWCDRDFECRQKYDSVRKIYERNVFFANLGIGIVVFVVALFLGLEAVSSGLMGGAVILIVYGTMRYWGELSDIWRTVFLGIALAILIWLGYKKFQD